MERWLGLLGQARRAFGFAPPVSGPDFWLLSGFAVSLILAAVVVTDWLSRLSVGLECAAFAGLGSRATDRSTPESVRSLRSQRGGEITLRSDYLKALAASPAWKDVTVPSGTYQQTASAILRTLEIDIAHRAVTAGLVVGLNRNSLVDAASIIAAALELQLHVLTRLGKRPSLRTWMEMLKRTTASLFLNWYVSREDALYLKLAIKKTAWGMGAASDLAQQTAEALEDFDWDHLSGSVGLPGLSFLGSLAAKGVGIGAFGLRHIGAFIESTADDLAAGRAGGRHLVLSRHGAGRRVSGSGPGTSSQCGDESNHLAGHDGGLCACGEDSAKPGANAPRSLAGPAPPGIRRR